MRKFASTGILATLLWGLTASAMADGNQIIITNVGVGQIDPNAKVPTTDGVAGAGVENWDIPTPIALLSVGQNYMFTMAFQDLSYSGSCSISARFTQVQNGKKVILKAFTLFAGTCDVGNTYTLGQKTSAMPNAPGPVTLSVKLRYGSQTATMNVPLVLK